MHGDKQLQPIQQQQQQLQQTQLMVLQQQQQQLNYEHKSQLRALPRRAQLAVTSTRVIFDGNSRRRSASSLLQLPKQAQNFLQHQELSIESVRCSSVRPQSRECASSIRGSSISSCTAATPAATAAAALATNVGTAPMINNVQLLPGSTTNRNEQGSDAVLPGQQPPITPRLQSSHASSRSSSSRSRYDEEALSKRVSLKSQMVKRQRILALRQSLKSANESRSPISHQGNHLHQTLLSQVPHRNLRPAAGYSVPVSTADDNHNNNLLKTTITDNSTQLQNNNNNNNSNSNNNTCNKGSAPGWLLVHQKQFALNLEQLDNRRESVSQKQARSAAATSTSTPSAFTNTPILPAGAIPSKNPQKLKNLSYMMQHRRISLSNEYYQFSENSIWSTGGGAQQALHAKKENLYEYSPPKTARTPASSSNGAMPFLAIPPQSNNRVNFISYNSHIQF